MTNIWKINRIDALNCFINTSIFDMNDAQQLFMEMSKREQRDFARSFGNFIGIVQKGDLFAYLYCIGPFYAELYYNTTNILPVKVIAFDNVELVRPYLEWIDISEIL